MRRRIARRNQGNCVHHDIDATQRTSSLHILSDTPPASLMLSTVTPIHETTSDNTFAFCLLISCGHTVYATHNREIITPDNVGGKTGKEENEEMIRMIYCTSELDTQVCGKSCWGLRRCFRPCPRKPFRALYSIAPSRGITHDKVP